MYICICVQSMLYILCLTTTTTTLGLINLCVCEKMLNVVVGVVLSVDDITTATINTTTITNTITTSNFSTTIQHVVGTLFYTLLYRIIILPPYYSNTFDSVEHLNTTILEKKKC